MEYAFSWITLHVRDIDASLAFYRDFLGLPLNDRKKPNPDLEIAFLGSGDSQVELMAHAGTTESTCGESLSIGFVVPDTLEAVMPVLAERGITVKADPVQPNPHIRFMFVYDPDGFVVQLIQRL